MSVSPADWKQAVLDEVGAELYDIPEEFDKVVRNIDTIWALWEAKAGISAHARYLYVKRACIDRILGQFRHFTNGSVGGQYSPQYGDKIKNLLDMRQEVTSQLEAQLAQDNASRLPVMGRITAENPIPATATGPPAEANGLASPNDRIYRGDAIRRRWPVYR